MGYPLKATNDLVRFNGCCCCAVLVVTTTACRDASGPCNLYLKSSTPSPESPGEPPDLEPPP